MSDQQKPRGDEIVLLENHALALRTTSLVERGLRNIARFEEIKQDDPWKNLRTVLMSEEHIVAVAVLHQHHNELEKKWSELCETVDRGNADIISASVKSEPWLLHWAAERGTPQIVASLINHGADTTVKDDSGRTALHEVLEGCREESGEIKPTDTSAVNQIIKLLVDGGADINMKDKYGHTPLDIEAGSGRTGVESFLRQLGAKLGSEIR